MLIGYARVSTDGQSVETQRETLAANGCERIFCETASGAKTDRIALADAIAALGADDVLIVTRLDRLARSTRDLLNIIESVHGRGARLRSLADPWADTTTPHGRLMVTVLGGLAEFERSLIVARTGEGRKRAIAAGVRMGAPMKLTSHQQREAVARLGRGEPVRDVARSYAVSRQTIERLAKRAVKD